MFWFYFGFSSHSIIYLMKNKTTKKSTLLKNSNFMLTHLLHYHQICSRQEVLKIAVQVFFPSPLAFSFGVWTSQILAKMRERGKYLFCIYVLYTEILMTFLENGNNIEIFLADDYQAHSRSIDAFYSTLVLQTDAF